MRCNDRNSKTCEEQKVNRRKLKALAYAKINLSLNVSGKTESGLHLLDSVTASVNIADAVTVCERFDSQINIT